MTTPMQASATPAELTLAGQTYQARPLSRQRWKELDRWAQQEVIRMAREAAEDMPADLRSEWMGAAFRQAAATTWGDLLAAGFGRNTLAIAVRLTRQMIRERHPLVNDEAIEDAFRTNPDELAAALDVFNLLHPQKKSETEIAEVPTATTPTM